MSPIKIWNNKEIDYCPVIGDNDISFKYQNIFDLYLTRLRTVTLNDKYVNNKGNNLFSIPSLIK